MAYPTLEQVEKADRLQLARWWRFLPSPGQNEISLLESQAKIMDRIAERFKDAGFFTPEISKAIGL